MEVQACEIGLREYLLFQYYISVTWALGLIEYILSAINQLFL